MLTSAIIQIGFFMGLLGSVHCVGMCGPLVMGLPLAHKQGVRKGFALVLYHFGKMMSYTLLGIGFGLLGSQFPIYKLQENLSVVMGIIMLLYVLYVFVLMPKQMLNLNFLYQPIVRLLSGLLKQENVSVFLIIGFLNGLLPCGMVYLALTSALATQHVWQGGLLMLFFGLGTAPALLLVSLGGQMVRPVFRNKLQSWLPFFIVTMGLVLILRGMNLGIPYLSPNIGIANQSISCHNS
ncbi:MAG: sulfite exporter TauE/SafE family protein [Chitinophagaceae bacterium]|nr:MAG: sulfite exporter TauE/SafE family protein [Chitinophagaceae bacterium]